MPKADVIKEGHKFPFNASELLISDNNIIAERFFEENIVEEPSDSEEEKEENEQNGIIAEEEKKENGDEENKKEDKPTVIEQDINTITKSTNEEKSDENHINGININDEDDDDSNSSKSKPDGKYKTEFFNLDYFFEFLSREDDCNNDILVGYFFKILYHLINIDPKKMIQYLFEPRRKPTIKKLIKILCTKSASESIKSILTVSSDIVDNYPEIRSEFCMELLTELNECNDNEDKCECITNIFQTSIESKPFFNYLQCVCRRREEL